MNDLRFAFRQLLKSPGFTIVAVLTLGIGIGANTAIFSFVNAMLLRPLPFQNPEGLVMVFENQVERGWHKNSVGPPVLEEWRRRSRSFEGLAARSFDDFILTGAGQPESVPGACLSANIFPLLGVKPLLGRDFLPEEETFGRHRVVILSHEFWQSRFGGDTNILGRSLSLNSEPCQVIGVMPPRTFFPDGTPRLWMPLAFSAERLRQRHNHSILVYGRLKPNVSLAQARIDMDRVAEDMANSDPVNKGWGAEVFPLQEIVVGKSRTILLVLLGSVGLVLLISCANIANLLLVRAAARSREFAIRTALGAGRFRIIVQLLNESLLLAALGGTCGLGIGQAALRLLVHLSPPDFPRVWEGISLDGLTLVFTAAITLLTGLVFGLAPALQTVQSSLSTELTDNSRGATTSPVRRRVRAALVIGEIAISLILLIGAGLMIRSFERLLSQPLGYVTEHLITMDFTLPKKAYSGRVERARFFEGLLDRVRVLPGVESAGLAYGLPLGGSESSLSVEIPGAPPPAPGESVAAGYSQISPGYFHTLGIQMVEGRDFLDSDRAGTPPVVIVDETFVRNFKLGSPVVGRQIHVGDGTRNAEIIGIAKDVKRTDLAQSPQGEMYRPYRQNCWGSMSLVLRTRRGPQDMLRAVRAEVDSMDKDLPIQQPRAMTQLIASTLAPRKLSMQVLGAFAVIALLLAAIGLYGVVASSVAQRRREIGIRMALGARRSDVHRLVLRQGMSLAAAGVLIGLLGALALGRVLASLLFEVTPNDLATFGVVSLALAVTALIACSVPAWRATRIDPVEALRAE